MAFSDEPTRYAGRRFECGWSERPQTGAELAYGVQEQARRLAEIDPAYGRIRPDPGARKFLVGDQGPVVDMHTAELADLIERGGRLDPPTYPSPVSSMGYSVLYRSDLRGLDPSYLALSVRAGRYGSGGVENRIGLQLDTEHAVWRDPERGLHVLDAMVQAWNPEWAIAYATVTVLATDGEITSRARPWLAWTAKPLRPRPNPPYARPYPAPFPLDDAGPPAEVRAWHGGELCIWP
jgi:hypothetical protein